MSVPFFARNCQLRIIGNDTHARTDYRAVNVDYVLFCGEGKSCFAEACKTEFVAYE